MSDSNQRQGNADEILGKITAEPEPVKQEDGFATPAITMDKNTPWVTTVDSRTG